MISCLCLNRLNQPPYSERLRSRWNLEDLKTSKPESKTENMAPAANVSCADCQSSFAVGELKNHIRLKLLYFPFLCYICRQEFLSSDMLEKIHFKSEHPNAKVRVLSNLDEKKERLLAHIYEASLKHKQTPSRSTPPHTDDSSSAIGSKKEAQKRGRKSEECSSEDIIELNPKTELPFPERTPLHSDAAVSVPSSADRVEGTGPTPKRPKASIGGSFSSGRNAVSREEWLNIMSQRERKPAPDKTGTGRKPRSTTQSVRVETQPERPLMKSSDPYSFNGSALSSELEHPNTGKPLKTTAKTKTAVKSRERTSDQASVSCGNASCKAHHGKSQGDRTTVSQHQSAREVSGNPANSPSDIPINRRSSPATINIQRVLARQRAHQVVLQRQLPTKPCLRLERYQQRPEEKGRRGSNMSKLSASPMSTEPTPRRLSDPLLKTASFLHNPFQPVRAIFRATTGLQETSAPDHPEIRRTTAPSKRKVSDPPGPSENQDPSTAKPGPTGKKPAAKRAKRVSVRKISLTNPASKMNPTDNKRKEPEVPETTNAPAEPTGPPAIPTTPKAPIADTPANLRSLGLSRARTAPLPTTKTIRKRSVSRGSKTTQKPTRKGRPRKNSDPIDRKKEENARGVSINRRLTRSRIAPRVPTEGDQTMNDPNRTPNKALNEDQNSGPVSKSKSRSRKSKDAANKMLSDLAKQAETSAINPMEESLRQAEVEIDIKPPVSNVPKTPARRIGQPRMTNSTKSRSSKKNNLNEVDPFMKFIGNLSAENPIPNQDPASSEWGAETIFQDSGLSRSVQVMKTLFDPSVQGNPQRYLQLLKSVQALNYSEPFMCAYEDCSYRFASPNITLRGVEEHILFHLSRSGYSCLKCNRDIDDPIKHSRSGSEHQVRDHRREMEESLIDCIKKCIPNSLSI